jgi:malate dehydrogenase
METKKLKVCITGAAGNIAYSLIPMIASGQVFGSRTSIHMSLLDLPNLEHALKGIAMELEDGAYHLLSAIEYGSDVKQMFKDCDVVIFLGGAARQPGQERRDLLMVNGKIFKEQGQALNEVAKETCKCLVVANPCNTNCLILSKYCPKIPEKNFTALSRLDHNRAQSQIASKLSSDPSQVKKIIIWGNHSSLQYPDISQTVLDGKKAEELINDENYVKKDFLKLIQHRGGEVLYQRKKSSGFSAAKAILDHMRDWMFGTESGNWVSMAVMSDGSYGIPEGLVFSFPVTSKDFEYEIVKGITISDFSSEQIQNGIGELEDERDEAMEDINLY